jgi:phenylacetate-CoA ligase
MFWQPDLETLPRASIDALQLQRLQSTVRRLARHVPLYRDRFRAMGLKPSHLTSLAELRHFPFTESGDLRAHYPDGMLALPRRAITRLHTSSGTTGKPKALFFSRRDVDTAATLMARCLVMSGTTADDVLQNMMTYGLFTGALVMHYGAEKVGLLVIPAGPGNSERQLLLMRDFRTTVIHATPSYALYFADFLEKQGLDPRKELALRTAYVGAEPYTEETRRRIEQALGLRVFNCYGLSEMNGPGVAFECAQQHGMHLWEDNYALEIIDPQTGHRLPDGERGELVLTTLCRQAMPLLRYRTRDITRVIAEPCPCGRTHRRIDRITGRSDDMLIVRGANFYPQQVERVLMSVAGLGRNYQIVLDGLDELAVRVELAPAAFDGQVEHLVALQQKLVDRIRTEIQIKPRIELVSPGTLPVSEGKARRVIDQRTL